MTGPLRGELADYLALRRSLGYRLARPEKLLNQFLDHLDQAGADIVTIDLALDWARLPAGGDANWRAHRLSVVRGFATYLHALDPAHEVPATTCSPGDRAAPARTCIPRPRSRRSSRPPPRCAPRCGRRRSPR